MAENPLEFAENLVRAAGILLGDYYQNAALKTFIKGDKSVSTEADLAVDRYITEQIRLQFPEDWLLSEELHSSLPDIKNDAKLPPVWIIDPVDGSTNFSLGLPVWGILCTRLVGGWPDITAMYFPIINELYTAKAGGGARLNGHLLHVENPAEKGKLPFFACCSRTLRYYQVSLPYKIRIFGSSAYTFCLVARGAAIIGFDARPKIWDIAGAWLLVKEAGGIIESFEGSQPFPLPAYIAFGEQNYPTVAAATDIFISKARAQIKIKEN